MTLLGVMWFDEIPDLFTVVGIVLIVLPMMPVNWKKLLKRKVSKRKEYVVES